jgi:hypothetical protein
MPDNPRLRNLFRAIVVRPLDTLAELTGRLVSERPAHYEAPKERRKEQEEDQPPAPAECLS